MLDTLRSILGPPQEDVRAPDASYEPIGDDEEDGSVGATAGRPTRVDEDKGVYWAFWALGAGVLLSWNGE
jgi:equilibrative nucleoside transporter 1/2/3